MFSEFAYGPWIPLQNPLIICGVHYLYFAVILFVISHFTFWGISLFTDLILDKHVSAVLRMFWGQPSVPVSRGAVIWLH